MLLVVYHRAQFWVQSGAVLAIRPGRPWPTQILAWPTQIYFWPTLAVGLPKVIVHII